jgi:hypothetical protein
MADKRYCSSQMARSGRRCVSSEKLTGCHVPRRNGLQKLQHEAEVVED